MSNPEQAPLLHATWSSLVFDYLTRQKLSGTGMSYFIVKQVACPVPADFSIQPRWLDGPLGSFIRERVLELSYTSHLLQSYAEVCCHGSPGEPFVWDKKRREVMRAEIDAAIMHLYRLGRSHVEHILDSFSVLDRNETRELGSFRTKRLVLEAYDGMATAAATGQAYLSPLDPPAGQGPRHRGADA